MNFRWREIGNMHNNVNTGNSEGFNIKRVGVYTVLCLLFGHLLLKDYMPNPLVGAGGFLILALILFYVICLKRYVFGFILVVFLCSHFNYANTQGGLWNLLTFGMIITYYLFAKPKKLFKKTDVLIKSLIIILVVGNIAGYLLKEPVMPRIPRLLGASAFFSYILMYYLASNQVITPKKVKMFFVATGIGTVCMFFAALNQEYPFIKFNTPLIGGYSAGSGGTIVDGVLRGGSTLNHYELFGEYAMLTIILLIPFIISRFTQRQLRLKGYAIGLIILLSVFNILMSVTRAAFLLVVLAGIFYLIVFIVFPSATADSKKSYMIYALVIIIFVFMFGKFVGLDFLKERMDQSFSSNVTIKGIFSGEDINRGPIFLVGLKRIQDEPWFVGYGWGVPESNAYAWFGKTNFPRLGEGLHSLYLSLPMLYGWFGSVALLLIIIITVIRLTFYVFKQRQSKNYLVTLSIALIFFWVFFLTDQYKISMLRSPNYHMIFWIWLGLSNAVTKTFKAFFRETASESITNSYVLGTHAGGLNQ